MVLVNSLLDRCTMGDAVIRKALYYQVVKRYKECVRDTSLESIEDIVISMLKPRN